MSEHYAVRNALDDSASFCLFLISVTRSAGWCASIHPRVILGQLNNLSLTERLSLTTPLETRSFFLLQCLFETCLQFLRLNLSCCYIQALFECTG